MNTSTEKFIQPDFKLISKGSISKKKEADLKALGGPGSGHFGHDGIPGEVGGSLPGEGDGAAKKKKAPKAPPVSLESKEKAYAEVKAGGTFKGTAAKYGMTAGQLAGYVWKTDQKKAQLETAMKADAVNAVNPTPEQQAINNKMVEEAFGTKPASPPMTNIKGEVVDPDAHKEKPISEMSDFEKKNAGYNEHKSGATLKATAQKYGLTQGQLSGFVWKKDQKLKKQEETTEAKSGFTIVSDPTGKAAPKAKIEPSISMEPVGKPWNLLTPDQKLARATETGHVWKPKTTGYKIGHYAWHDESDIQVSKNFQSKEAYREALDTINYGKGIDPPLSPAQKAALQAELNKKPVDWPINDLVVRDIGQKYQYEIETHNKHWLSGLSSGEQKAIDSYTGSGYGDMNSALRSGKPASYSVTNQRIKDLTTALNKAPKAPPPDLVWRGVRSGSAAQIYKKLTPGQIIEMKGFQSTSIKPSFAADWAGSEGVIFEIKPKQGGLVRTISATGIGEHEFLLNHGEKYRVRGAVMVKMKQQHGSGIKQVRVIQLEHLK